MKRAIIIAAMLLLGAVRAGAQVDPCLALYQNVFPNQGDFVSNPDSAMVDTCMDAEYHEEFIRTYFKIYFSYFMFPDSEILIGDTVFDSSWSYIDTTYPEIRKGFSNIEKRFGPFSLFYQGGILPLDTSDARKKIGGLTFSNYVNVDSVLFYLDSIPDNNAESDDGIERENGIVHQEDSSKVKIWPQPCGDILYISGATSVGGVECFDQIGRQLHFPATNTSEVLSLDVSNSFNGVFFIRVDGNFLRIVVQK